MDQFTIIKVLGQGDFSIVYEVKWEERKDGVYALKVVRNNCESIKVFEDIFYNEIEIMKKMGDMSPNVYYYDMVKNNIGEYIGLILMDKIDGTIINKNNIVNGNIDNIFKRLNKKDVDNFFELLLENIVKMNKMKIYHLDLHPLNIGYKYINNSDHKIIPIIIDFGLATIVNDLSYMDKHIDINDFKKLKDCFYKMYDVIHKKKRFLSF